MASRHFPYLPAGLARAPWSSLTGAGGVARGIYVLRLERGDGSAENAGVMVMR